MNEYINKDKQYLIQCYTTDDMLFTHGEGMYLYDEKGNRYLDFSAQFSSCSLGHKNQEMIDALKDQMEKIVNVTSCFATEERAMLAEKLVSLAPDGIDMVMFGRTVQPLSYLYAVGLTIIFSLLVNLLANRRLRKIDMVESLKSVE